MPQNIDAQSKVITQSTARVNLIHKTVRFFITSGLPLLAAYAYGVGNWLLYLILGAILGFVGDAGGKPLLRLGFMAIGPTALVIGAFIGTICAAANVQLLFFLIAILTGFLYGLVENRHGHMVMAPRFLGYGLVFGYSVSPINFLDIALLVVALIWAWLISLMWDFITHDQRPFSLPSLRKSIIRGYLKAPTRWYFATSCGISVALALLTCVFTGNTHAYWTMLTMLIVLHYDMKSSAAQISNRVTGTLIGVFSVILLVYLQASPLMLLLAAIMVTALRWPAFSIHSSLGTACITAFVLLLAELMAAPGVDGIAVLKDRLLATFIGCSFSLFTLNLDAFLHKLFSRQKIKT